VVVAVRLKGIRVERSRQFGDVYLALALWRGTGLAELCERLLPAGKERVPWEKMAAVLVAARLCQPSSELHIAEDWYRRTALGDLLQLDEEQVNKDRLYRALDRLLVHKKAVEAHLSHRCGELFSTDNEVLLYDVTSTYLEGQAEANPLAQRSYSRDHRPDCKQVCIALVVTFDGFPLGYEVFAGNTHDSRTLQTIVTTMEARHGVAGRVWIGDRGMASAENLAWLRETGRRYIIGAPKSELKQFASSLEHFRIRLKSESAVIRESPNLGRFDPARKCSSVHGRLAHDPRGRRGQAHRLPRERGDHHPVPLGRTAQQRTGDAREIQRSDRSRTDAPGGADRRRQEASRSDPGEPADRPDPAEKPARRRAFRGAPARRQLSGRVSVKGRN
jgi:Transposase DDE domain